MLSDIRKKLERNQAADIQVKITPSAGQNEVKQVLQDNTIKIDIAAPPEKGKANRELIKFLARELGVEKNNVTIIKGKNSRFKSIRVAFD